MNTHMRGSSLTSVSLLVLVLAVAAWVGVWFMFSDISGRLNSQTQLLSRAAVKNAQQQNAVETTALAADTAAERASLDGEVATDVVGIANQIQNAGKAAGVTTDIGSASTNGATNMTSSTTELVFVVQSAGTFAQVWRAAQLFETLPLPSSVQELDFSQSPSDAGKSSIWQLTAHIEVLTSSQVSS
jgi:hypothetical protein